MAKIERTVRMTVAVTFPAYDMDDESDQPYYPSERLLETVGYWFKQALFDREDSPELKIVLSKLERKIVE